ncbi:hypothetical protein F2Q70_00042998 [Brassica cretica]|uniref:Uncharacterized protein n=1 Tax=Brassica cretica TaxID=69181 RepID=A0A3N6TWD0_BRACR|nr:hypothetical protein F2Q70_00042998 [Brassica cretica]KAF3611711.1 hypothetical protein DY000_02050559 [Brassica cretica]
MLDVGKGLVYGDRRRRSTIFGKTRTSCEMDGAEGRFGGGAGWGAPDDPINWGKLSN